MIANADVVSAIRDAHPLVEDVQIVDMYQGKRTYRVWMRAPDRTLTKQEAAEIMARVVEAVEGLDVEVVT